MLYGSDGKSNNGEYSWYFRLCPLLSALVLIHFRLCLSVLVLLILRLILFVKVRWRQVRWRMGASPTARQLYIHMDKWRGMDAHAR